MNFRFYDNLKVSLLSLSYPVVLFSRNFIANPIYGFFSWSFYSIDASFYSSESSFHENWYIHRKCSFNLTYLWGISWNTYYWKKRNRFFLLLYFPFIRWMIILFSVFTNKVFCSFKCSKGFVCWKRSSNLFYLIEFSMGNWIIL